MGAYLSKPVTEKVSTDETGKTIAYGASSMQGWRITQEDAHNCCIDFGDNSSLFAVYDGHGGHEVALYCSKYLPDFIKNTEAYKNKDTKQALIDSFLGLDATLVTPEVISVLKDLAGSNKSVEKKIDEEDSDDEDNVNNLRIEAEMPLEDVIAKYQSDASNITIKNLANEGCSSRLNFASPYLRSKKADRAVGKDAALIEKCNKGASCSSSNAGCSSSSSTSWNTNEADVSSSSQSCESSTTSTSPTNLTDNNKAVQPAGSSEADQVLDSTTTINGDTKTEKSSDQVESTVDSGEGESVKSGATDMPDSSEDATKETSTKDFNDINEVNTTQDQKQSEAEVVNGSQDNVIEGNKALQDADSSKTGNDNVSSSSCTSLLENGEAEEQQQKISSSDTKARNKILRSLYKTLLLRKGEVESDDDEDDDENDESFDGVRESESDEEIEHDASTEEEDDLENAEEGETSTEDEFDDDDDDDDDEEEGGMELQEPGYDSGCTAVVAILEENDLYVANAGDSRCVLCRDGVAVELSDDHKPEDQLEMERIVRAGGKVTADGRVNGGLNLSRAIGDHTYKKNSELPAKDQMISALPDIRHVTIDPSKDEFMILACDGIWNSMSSQTVINFVRTRLQDKHENISKICEELFDNCLAPNTMGDGTGCDNMTAIIVQFKSPKNGTKDAVTAKVTSVTKKRPMSPNLSSEENNDCSGNRDNVIDECKRIKTDIC